MDDSGFLEEGEEHVAPVEGNVVDLGPDFSKLPRTSLADVLRDFDPISVGTEPGREYIVVAPKGTALAEEPGITQLALQDFALPKEKKNSPRVGISQTGIVRPHDRVDFAAGIGVTDSDMTSELGTAVASPWTSWTRQEYNNDLMGYKGLRIYDKMRKSDGTVRGTLRLAKTPVLAGMWGMKPASDKKRDKNIADYIWQNLQTWMSMSFPQFMTESLLMLDFGYYMFEKVFAHGEDVTNDPRAKGKIVWKKFAPRHPMDVKEWYFDINGGPLSVDMWAPPVQIADLARTGSSLSYQVSPEFQGGVVQAYQRWINIPIDKLLVFTFDKEAGDISGTSLLRSAYKHWYYKDNLYKIDAIQKERHGIGIPIVQLPVGYSKQDKDLADQLGRNLRTNERAHVVLPPGWILEFAELKGHPVDCLPSIQHHDNMIPQSILGAFLNKQQTGAGSEELHTIFLKATRFTADIVVDTINKYAIPQLVNFNWSKSIYPEMYVKRIGEQEDWRTQSFTLRNYVGAGIIVPDDALENQIRDEMGLPLVDPATARIVRTPAQSNVQKIQPAPTEEPGPGHITVPAQMPGVPPTPNQVNPATGKTTGPQGGPGKKTPNSPSTSMPKVGAPRVGLPKSSAPGVGGVDRSGKSGRRGQ